MVAGTGPPAGSRVHSQPATVAPMRTSRAYRPSRRLPGVGRKMLIVSPEDRMIVDHSRGPDPAARDATFGSHFGHWSRITAAHDAVAWLSSGALRDPRTPRRRGDGRGV